MENIADGVHAKIQYLPEQAGVARGAGWHKVKQTFRLKHTTLFLLRKKGFKIFSRSRLKFCVLMQLSAKYETP